MFIYSRLFREKEKMTVKLKRTNIQNRNKFFIKQNKTINHPLDDNIYIQL